MRSYRAVFLILSGIGFLNSAWTSETDQYLVWDVELADSADALNHYLNTEIQAYLAKRSEVGRTGCRCEDLTADLYKYFFRGLHASRLRKWLFESDGVDRFPGRAVTYGQYCEMSIYRRRSFPPWLPMARTIRVGEVYLGVDKISHFFGFGRRYFRQYRRYQAKGLSDDEAMERVVNRGIALEKSLVGGFVDGIFSHADLEANFQGMMMAKDFCFGDLPYLKREGDAWVLARPLDIRLYVTPDFDESYNISHYSGMRKKKVLPVLKEKYREKLHLPLVEERFRRYAVNEPSLSKRQIDAHFASRERNPQAEQSLEVLFTDNP